MGCLGDGQKLREAKIVVFERLEQVLERLILDAEVTTGGQAMHRCAGWLGVGWRFYRPTSQWR